MREILFRGKLTKINKWIYGSLAIDGDKYSIYDEEKRMWFPVDKQSVGQFIGLFDHAGKIKIFEGDVVVATHHWSVPPGANENDFKNQKIQYAYNKRVGGLYSGPCSWKKYLYDRNYSIENDAWTGGWRIRNKNVWHRINPSSVYNLELMVVGNTYDNPELLDVEDNNNITLEE